MVRVNAFLFATVFAEESLMQAHELDLLGGQGSSHTSRMAQNTKQMESQYRDMLENIVRTGSWDDPATGNPWVPNRNEVLEPIKGVLKMMEDELSGQNVLNNGIMNSHTDSVSACNTALTDSLHDEIVPKMASMIGARATHKSCRNEEDTAITNMESTCSQFDEKQKATCNHEQNWFAAIAGGESGVGTLRETVDLASACRTDIQDTTSKAQACDTAQGDFTQKWCDYKSELDSSCDTYDTCYNGKSANWNQAEGTIRKLEGEQKIIYRMVNRIKCYLDLLFRKSDGGATPVQKDITDCEGATVTDTPLDITYGTVVDKLDCYNLQHVKDEQVTNAPGDGGGAVSTWYMNEFAKLSKHSKLNDDSSC